VWKYQTTSKFIRSAVAMALCYAVVLQAFFAGCSIGLGVSQASTSAATVICHGGDGDSPPGPDNHTPANHPCLVCAICTLATAGGLTAPLASIAGSWTAAHRVVLFDIAALAAAPPARAGLARAPPKFA
jgi:Protein of unknown function (DUF2946)